VKTAPYAFQIPAINALASHPHFLLGDDPGLGKTISAIGALEKVSAYRNLVVAPASVCPQWREVLNYESPEIAKSTEVISYNKAQEFALHAKKKKLLFDALILDEAHFLKTSESQRTKAIFSDDYGLARRAHFKWALTGTPVLNRPRELYPIMSTLAGHLIAPYNSYNAFAQRWCGAYWEGPNRGMNDRGASRTEELAQRLSQFMLRREMAEVLPWLPPQIVTRVPLTLSKEDNEIINEAEREIENRESYISTVMEDYSQLGDSARLCKAVGLAKINSVVRFVDDLLETVDKIVVFAWHREVVEALRDRLSERGCSPVLHYGGLSDSVKARNKQTFITDKKCKVFIGNIRSSGTGLDGLQKVSNNAVFAELSWTPGEMDQCVGRLKRLGAVGGAVNAYIPHVPGTIESAILGSHDGKVPVIKMLVGDGRTAEPVGLEHIFEGF